MRLAPAVLSLPTQAWRSRGSDVLLSLMLLAMLLYGGLFASYMLANFDLVNLLRDVNNDDSFYYFQIAKNLAAGEFSTFDGGITRTNGFHPVWLLLITPFYWVFDRETALFGIKAFEIMLIAGGAVLVVAAARIASLLWVMLFATLPLLYRAYALFLGLEAAAGLFSLGLLFFALALFARNPGRWRLLLAATAFALPWVRLEYAAIALAATVTMGLVEWNWQDAPRSPRSWKALVRSIWGLRAAVPVLGAFLGTLTLFAYNKLIFGGLLPVSAASKRAWSQARWEQEGGYSLAENLSGVLEIGAFNDELLISLAICVYIAVVYWFARRSRSREDWMFIAFLVGAFSLSVGHLAKFAQTVLMVHPFWGGYSWYFAPAYLIKALFVPISCYVAFYVTRRTLGPRTPALARDLLAVGLVVAAAAVVLLLAYSHLLRPFRFVDTVSDSTVREWEMTSYMGTRIMNLTLPEGSIVGSWDAGVIGYFSDFPVVNLDGLVNSYDYMRARKEGEARTFYDRFGLTHFANVRSTKWEADDTLFEGVSFPREPTVDYEFKLWSAEPLEPDGPSGGDAWFWERMRPHFHYAFDDVSILAGGRLVQMFVEDCEPERFEGAFAFSEVNGGRIEAEWRPESLRVNRLGYCADAFELPNDAALPVRVERAGHPRPGG